MSEVLERYSYKIYLKKIIIQSEIDFIYHIHNSCSLKHINVYYNIRDHINHLFLK